MFIFPQSREFDCQLGGILQDDCVVGVAGILIQLSTTANGIHSLSATQPQSGGDMRVNSQKIRCNGQDKLIQKCSNKYRTLMQIIIPLST
jgi:hypothetical protein